MKETNKTDGVVFPIKFKYEEKYLPTKRHSKPRYRQVEATFPVTVKQLQAEEFPIAFIVHNYKSVYEGAKEYKDFYGWNGDFRIFPEEVRTYDGKFYKSIRISSGSAVSTCYEPISYIQNMIEREARTYRYINVSYDGDFTDKSIVIESNLEDIKKDIVEGAKYYIICDDKVWLSCGEPMYHIQTFGLGGNHGRTSLFIEFVSENFFRPEETYDNYFTALQREEAIAYRNETALKRGDRKYIRQIEEKNIEVLLPELVEKRKKRHYKEFEKHHLGYSDCARLILAGWDRVEFLPYGKDGYYYAYFVDENAEIDAHYKEVARFTKWLKIYDDETCQKTIKGKEIIIYRAGSMGTVVQIIK